LILGLGAGGIMRAIPSSCSITGVDRAAALQRLGQDSTTYQPPEFHPKFDLHPISWLTSGNVLEPEVGNYLLTETREGKYSTVIIDIEGSTASERLLLRHQFALAGAKSWVKIPAYGKSRAEIINSFFAYKTTDDRIWSPDIDLSKELIIGHGPGPMGLKVAAVSQPHDHAVSQLGTQIGWPTNTEKEDSINLAHQILYGSPASHPWRAPESCYHLPCPMGMSQVFWRNLTYLVDYDVVVENFVSPNRLILKCVLCLLHAAG